MAIATAVQKGQQIYMYDERGRHLGTVAAGDGLQGYTAGSVSVRKGSMIYTYDEKGRHLGSVSAR